VPSSSDRPGAPADSRDARDLFDLTGRLVVVTGGTRGLGLAMVRAFASAGAEVVVVSRKAEACDEVVAALRSEGLKAAGCACHVGHWDELEPLVDRVYGDFGRIDVLVNNAGIEEVSRAEEGRYDLYRHIFDVNFFGVVDGTLAVLTGMLARKSGIIVNVSSDSARAPEPGHGAYAASKAAVSAFTESVAHEVADRGVHVHVFYPAWVPTAMSLSDVDAGEALPPKAVRRSDEQVSALLLQRMGGRRVEINAAALPLLAPIARTVAPISYQNAIRHRSR
jgi:NAD(P)-dependent dehydrogenase (short-subunit alcohol dehydrogenase family)